MPDTVLIQSLGIEKKKACLKVAGTPILFPGGKIWVTSSSGIFLRVRAPINVMRLIIMRNLWVSVN